jgi:branched-chain amino acid aminotransferase
MGITRQKLLEMLHTLNIERIEMDIALDSLADFEACFLTGTSIHILPICCIDDTQYASSTNPLILKLEHTFKKIIHDDLENIRRQQL